MPRSNKSAIAALIVAAAGLPTSMFGQRGWPGRAAPASSAPASAPAASPASAPNEAQPDKAKAPATPPPAATPAPAPPPAPAAQPKTGELHFNFKDSPVD